MKWPFSLFSPTASWVRKHRLGVCLLLTLVSALLGSLCPAAEKEKTKNPSNEQNDSDYADSVQYMCVHKAKNFRKNTFYTSIHTVYAHTHSVCTHTHTHSELHEIISSSQACISDVQAWMHHNKQDRNESHHFKTFRKTKFHPLPSKWLVVTYLCLPLSST